MGNNIKSHGKEILEFIYIIHIRVNTYNMYIEYESYIYTYDSIIVHAKKMNYAYYISSI